MRKVIGGDAIMVSPKMAVTGTSGAKVDSNPWLMLGLSATDKSMFTNGSTTVTPIYV